MFDLKLLQGEYPCCYAVFLCVNIPKTRGDWCKGNGQIVQAEAKTSRHGQAETVDGKDVELGNIPEEIIDSNASFSLTSSHAASKLSLA